MAERMEAIYAWTEEDPNGGEGVIFAYIPLINASGTLQHRNLDICQREFRDIAMSHQKASGNKVRLVRFARMADVEELP